MKNLKYWVYYSIRKITLVEVDESNLDFVIDIINKDKKKEYLPKADDVLVYQLKFYFHISLTLFSVAFHIVKQNVYRPHT